MSGPAYSAYGLQVTGLPEGLPLQPGDTSWPSVQIVNGAPAAPATGPRFTADRGEFPLPDDRLLVLDRAAGEARFHGPPLLPDELAHPYLGAVATVWNRWLGRDCFHAGAFVADGRAWAVRGEREAGKSTVLAALAARDVPVLTDDVVVVDGSDVLAGPRCVDLRTPVPGVAGVEERSRYGSRFRMLLPPAPASVPLGGWIFLAWGDEPSIERLDATRLLQRVAAGRGWPALGDDPGSVLGFATLPGWIVTRRPAWPELPGTLDHLLALTAEAPAAPPLRGR